MTDTATLLIEAISYIIWVSTLLLYLRFNGEGDDVCECLNCDSEECEFCELLQEG